MIFTSTIFIFGFLPIVLVGALAFKRTIMMSNIFLLIVSIGFYAWGEPRYFVLILFSIITNWSFALLIEALHNQVLKNALLGTAAFFNIAALIVFKYLNWGITLYNTIYNGNFSKLQVAIPIGISFYTFQALSYIIDVWRNKIRAQKSLIKLGLYITFFPQLIAGPIVRYADIEEQISCRKITWRGIESGIERFMKGVSKKILLADSLAIIADKAFLLNSQGGIGIGMAWLGALSYMFQIYYDFSGYSDMAIGLGRILGFTFGENFNYPYSAKTVTDFWHRWHMSLSTWFRDYVYIPLGGSRKGNIRTIFNLAVTWLITGVWHGANMTFLLWGGIYGSIIILEKIFIMHIVESNRKIKMIYKYLTLLIVLLCWVIFRSESITLAWNYIKTMFSVKFIQQDIELLFLYSKEFIIELLMGLALCIPINLKILKNNKFVNSGRQILLCFCYLISISYIIKGTYSPFIYFNF